MGVVRGESACRETKSVIDGPVPVVLASWAVGTVVMFAARPGRDAALVAMIAGWALLPNADYPASAFAPPVGSGGSFHALAVPTGVLFNKALSIGLGCLFGLILFDWPSVRRARPCWLDLPAAVWCLTPIASALVNGLGPAWGLSQSRYLALAWGVPYLLGRIYLGDNESLRRWGIGLALGGLAYVPLCLAEVVARPFLYGVVYGPQPYQNEGEARPLGFRPVVFQEHGNQLGLWVALAAVASVWLWRSGRLRAVAGIPGGWVASGLVGLCLVCQSLGAVALAAAALAALPLLRSRGDLGPSRAAPVLAVAAVLAVAVAAGVLAMGTSGGLRQALRGAFSSAGKVSFTWRMARYEDNLRRAAERPILGRGRADWSNASDGTFVNPVNLGLWFHALGMFGAVGLVASTAVFAGPVIEVARWLPARAWLNPGCSAVTLAAALLLVSLADSLLNSTVVLPVLAGAGGVNSWAVRRWGDDP